MTKYHVLTEPPFSVEIMRDWFNLIDDDGWVGREQILGEEARSKVKPFSLIPDETTYTIL